MPPRYVWYFQRPEENIVCARTGVPSCPVGDEYRTQVRWKNRK